MTAHLAKTHGKPTVTSLSEMKLVFDFLKVSSSAGLSGPALEDRLLTSLAIALHQRSEAH